jgi:hypothetical protein
MLQRVIVLAVTFALGCLLGAGLSAASAPPKASNPDKCGICFDGEECHDPVVDFCFEFICK